MMVGGVVVWVIRVLACGSGRCRESLRIVCARTLMREPVFLVMLQLRLEAVVSSNNSNHARRLHVSRSYVFNCDALAGPYTRRRVNGCGRNCSLKPAT